MSNRSALPRVAGSFLARFVDVFEGLERENGGADFAGLAVPDEFDLALVLEEEEAVFLRQRLALLDELDEVALFGVGEVVGVCLARPWSTLLNQSWYSVKAGGQARQRSWAGASRSRLVDEDESIGRSAFGLAGGGGVGAPLRSRAIFCGRSSSSRPLVSTIHTVPSVVLDDEVRHVVGKLAVRFDVVELEADGEVVLGERCTSGASSRKAAKASSKPPALGSPTILLKSDFLAREVCAVFGAERARVLQANPVFDAGGAGFLDGQRVDRGLEGVEKDLAGVGLGEVAQHDGIFQIHRRRRRTGGRA